MNKVNYKEAMQTWKELCESDIYIFNTINGATERLLIEETEGYEIINNFIEQHRPPTFDEVVKAWEKVIAFKHNDEKTRLSVKQRDNNTVDIELDWYGNDGLKFTKDRYCIRKDHTIIFKPIRKSELFSKDQLHAINLTI